MATFTNQTVYYLPGHGGQLATGLGQGMMYRCFDVAGRETRGDFRMLTFDEQVQTTVNDLQNYFWHPSAQVVCNSFGVYLFLQTQAFMPSFVGRVLLSPIVGEFANAQARIGFSPPRPERLKKIAEAGQLTGIPITVVPKGWHDLGKAYVGSLLDRWLIANAA